MKYEFMFILSSREEKLIMYRCAVVGLIAWVIGTIVLRLGGQYVFDPQHVFAVIALFILSFPAMWLLARAVCSDAKLAPDRWPVGTIVFLMPALVLDTFTAAFFTTVYPNIPAEAAGWYGGWLLWCCAGAFAGTGFWRK
jgi:Family of unknown function (DUF5367)